MRMTDLLVSVPLWKDTKTELCNGYEPSFAVCGKDPLPQTEKGNVMTNILDKVDAAQLRDDIPAFRPGDTLDVEVKVIEGSTQRTQLFRGVCIRRQGSGIRETFTVRKVSFGIGVERTFPVHSPNLDSIKVSRRGRVRRAKLYYLRDLQGKKARIKERR